MLQKIILEFHESKIEGLTSFANKNLFSKSFNPLSFSKKVLYHKYSKFEYSYSLICTNNLIFNEKCRIVARFKDFLVLDDSTEFLRRLYFKKELKNRLNKIYNFYESYCKIFPNYMILPENQFLYWNIRKKQKMIDAYNEIRKEEEENKKYLRLGLMSKNKEENIIFTEKIQESIDKYHPSVSNILSSTFMSEISNNFNNLNKETESNEKSMVTISLSSYRNLKELNNNNNEIIGFDKYFTPNRNSFKDKDKNINNNNTSYSQNSIFSIINILNSDNNMNENEKKSINNNDNNSLIKISNKNYSKYISQMNNNKNPKSNTISNKNINNKNIKSNTKKLLNMNHHNYNHNIKDKNNLNLDLNKIYNNNSIEKKPNQKKDNNTIANTIANTNTNLAHNKLKFISHKQAGSVPLASNMLSSNDNNIIKDNNTIKIINNINNIIINDGKNNQIKNGMVININNNYFHLKDPKNLNNKIIKRVKSKDEEKKSKSKDKGIKNNKNEINNNDIDDKDDELPQYKIFREKTANTHYNTNNNDRKKKEFLLNKIPSPNIKKKSTINVNNKNLNIENKTKSINSNNYYVNINSNNKQNNIYRNSNNFTNENKKHNKKLIESETVNNNSHTVNNKNMTEINNNTNLIDNKLKISINKNIKDKPKIEGVDSVHKKTLSINRKIVKNFLTTTKKRKTYQGKFQALENSSLNTFNVNHSKKNENLNAPSKIEMLNLCNTINTKNNPIKFKLDKKNMLKKTKTNSLQINDNNQFLSSFNLTKDKIPCSTNELDIINIEDNIVNYHKKLIRKSVNHKTQCNSEAELFKENINKNYILTNENIKNENDKNKNINDKKNTYNNKTNSNEIRKLNVKEMKEKYHKLLRGNKATHGSYDTTNRFHLYKRFKAVNGVIGNMTNITNNIINNTTTSIKNKRSPLNKKGVLSPSERITDNITKYINTPIKNMLNMTHKESSVENNNMFSGNKFFLMEKKNKKYDVNNKKLKYVKK